MQPEGLVLWSVGCVVLCWVCRVASTRHAKASRPQSKQDHGGYFRIRPMTVRCFGPYQHNSSFPTHWVEIRAKIRCMSGPYLKRRPKTDIKPVSVISNPVDSFTSALPQFPISPSTVRSPVSRGQQLMANTEYNGSFHTLTHWELLNARPFLCGARVYILFLRIVHPGSDPHYRCKVPPPCSR